MPHLWTAINKPFVYSIYNKCIDTYNTEITTIFSLGFNPNQLDGNPKEQIEINQRYM